ncbi:hypothetical protein IMZ48_24690 [Candidatus Bathyarchaeota archaeon]|nr:hypothetical protein [Candidatus Bathyarchaeota archaeon]
MGHDKKFPQRVGIGDLQVTPSSLLSLAQQCPLPACLSWVYFGRMAPISA